MPRGPLLDAGCGSGVLSVAAAKLGFAPVHAFDDDPFAIETTRANAAANGVVVEALLGDVTRDDLPVTSSAVANIALAVQSSRSPRESARAELVASGYLEADAPQVSGWTHVERRVLDGWAADRFRRSP